MNFTSLVKYIKECGCRVRIYNKKTLGSNVGTFHVTEKGPLISIALGACTKKKAVEYLLHEFGHYLQWQDGFMQTLDGICDANTLWDRWLNREIELSSLEQETARNIILAMEWDAEMRALEVGKALCVEHFDPVHHIKGANVYVLAIKWSWSERKKVAGTPKRKEVKPIILTNKKLFAPLTKKEKLFLAKYKGV